MAQQCLDWRFKSDAEEDQERKYLAFLGEVREASPRRQRELCVER